VASDPTVSRTIDALAVNALAAINTARAVARKRSWALAGTNAPDAGADAKNPLIVDLEKTGAAAAYQRGFGFHPLCSFVDHGPDGTGEPLTVMLRPGNAGSNTAVDHIEVLTASLAQLRSHQRGTRAGRKVLIRTDGAGATHAVLDWLAGQRLPYLVGSTLPDHTPDLLDLTHWPAGMRVIARKERPHPGAQLRITDIDGHRVTTFASSTRTGGPGTQLPDLGLRHRRRARCEDRIRTAKDTGLRAFPLAGFDQNQIWCHVVDLAAELTAWLGDARAHRPRSASVGTPTIAATPVHRPSHPGADRAARRAPPRECASLSWPHLDRF